jgi:tetratricopeptide (TPR) repeat protein
MKTKKNLWALLLFLAFVLQVNAQNKSRIEIFKASVAAEKVGDINNAINIMAKYYSDNKKDYLFNLRLGWLYYLKGDFNTSVFYYQNAVRISSKSVEALLGLTFPYSKMNKLKELKRTYETILDKDPGNYKANFNLGLIYFNQGDYLNSMIYFEKVIKNYPSDYSANLYLGWANYYVGGTAKAHKYFENALISVPNDPSALKGYKATK